MTREERNEQIHYEAVVHAENQPKPTDYVIAAKADHFNGFVEGFEEGARWADEHPHWISVEELPKIGKDVLVLREDGEMQVAHQYNESIARWWSVDGFPLKNNITHWMPLPQPPKKGGKQ